MMPHEFVALVDSMTVGAFAMPMRFAAIMAPYTDDVEVRIWFAARDVEDSSRETRIFMVERFPLSHVEEMDRKRATWVLRNLAERAVLHEFDEWMTIDGQRNSPHAHERRRAA